MKANKLWEALVLFSSMKLQIFSPSFASSWWFVFFVSIKNTFAVVLRRRIYRNLIPHSVQNNKVFLRNN